MRLIEDKDIPRYLFHRYRYEIYPQLHKLDDYPPYLQIEPSSICNYRCVFCYQTDEGFSEKNLITGTMSLEMYKQSLIRLHIEFLSLASRGEPLICKDFEKMMIYSIGKFLNLKVNRMHPCYQKVVMLVVWRSKNSSLRRRSRRTTL